MKYGIIAGNGRFPVLALEEARRLGHEVVAFAIKDEASPDVERLAARCHWISIAELSKLIDLCHKESVTELMMCGQVKHVSIFSSLRPDWRLAKLLFSLEHRNTDALIGGVVKVLASEGIRLSDSTRLLTPLLAAEGPMTRRKPDESEQRDIDYGRKVAHALATADVGQSVAIAERACVAAEAMEGTDAMLRRAASLAAGKRLALVKVSTRRRHRLFDVPVVGPGTIAVMVETKATVLAIDAARTLLLDRTAMLAAADQAGIAVTGYAALDVTPA